MTAEEVVEQLKLLGTDAYRNVLRKHGIQEPLFGVKVEELKKIQKRVKTDYRLALDLYDTGIYDAMYLAGLIADDARMTKKDLRRWAEKANCPALSEYTVAWVASGSPHGRELALEWIESKKEGVAASGWATLSGLVATREDSELDLEELKRLLRRVQDTIHEQPNRARYAMNGFVIAVGSYVRALTDLALQTAAAEYIQKGGVHPEGPEARGHPEGPEARGHREEAQDHEVLRGRMLWRTMHTDKIGPTPEMLAFFEHRTAEHIERVRVCLALLADLTEYGEELLERAKVHDASKYGAEERIPYVWLTEYHRCRRSGEAFEYPEGMAERVKLAIKHHVTSNRHHPEFHADPNAMSEVDLIEMVCDWTAMAQEFGEAGGSARGWADRTIGKQVAFNEEKRRFIYQVIEELDRQIAAKQHA